MRKIFILLLLTLTLTSCKKDEPFKGDPLTIREGENFKEEEERNYGVDDSIRYDRRSLGLPSEFEKAEVLNVIDGDTIEVNIDGTKEVVRLIGIDSPNSSRPHEDAEPFGGESANFAKENLSGMNVFLRGGLNNRDQYGRLLRYVWLEVPEGRHAWVENPELKEKEVREKLFNAKLIEKGFAKTLSIRPNVQYDDIFKKIEEEAKLNQRGIWGDLKVIKGNNKTKIYYTPNDDRYDKLAEDSIEYFKTEDEAIANGYRKNSN